IQRRGLVSPHMPQTQPAPPPPLIPNSGPARPLPTVSLTKKTVTVLPAFRHYAAAAIGSIVIGVTLPSILVAMRVFHTAPTDHPIDALLTIEFYATFGCGPGALLLSVILMAILS